RPPGYAVATAAWAPRRTWRRRRAAANRPPMRDTGTGPPGRSCASGGNCGLWIADCGFEVWASNPQSEIRSPHCVLRQIMQVEQVVQRAHAPLRRAAQQGAQDARRRERVAEGAMASRVLDAEERRHLLQPAMAQLGHEAAGEPDGAQGRTLGRRNSCRRAFHREKAPVEAG